MKNILFLLSLMLVVMSSQAQVPTGYTFPPDTAPAVYRVLMEEYTGHFSGSSPGTESMLYNTITPVYTDTLVVVSVHASFFAVPCPPHTLPVNAPPGSYSDDFRTLAGETWYSYFSITSNPVGMVSRTGYPSSTHVKTPSAWGPTIAGIIHSTPKVKIRIYTEYNPQTRQLDVYTETKFLTQLNGNYMLQAVLTEDSITAWQMNYSLPSSNKNDSDYVERYVMRGSLNGDFGEQLNTSSPTPAGTIFLRNYSDTLPLAWNENRIHVVAFVYDDSTKEVLNVAEDGQLVIISGMDEPAPENLFTIFPNPASDNLIITSASPGEKHLNIYNSLGEKILSGNFSSQRHFINVSSFAKGIYFIEVRSGRAIATKRMVKM